MSAAVAEEPSAQPCAICGGPLPPGRRVVCSPACRRERDRLLRRRPVAGLGQPAQHVGLRELAVLVAHDRAEHGELRDVEWSPDDCPRKRGDSGPCIHVGCRHHACSDTTKDGRLWIDPAFEADPYSVPLTCRLDDATTDPDGETLEQVGRRFNLTRERIRQIEAKALRKLGHPSRSARPRELLELADEADRPGTPLGAIQGAGPSLGSSHGGTMTERGLGAAPSRMERPPCRHPEAPHVAPPPPRRQLHGLPPSLQGHEAELGAKPLRDGDSRPAWQHIAEWRREDCDTDCDGVEDPGEVMEMTTETKERPLDRARQLLDRRTELTGELAGVEAELAGLREELRRDPYVEAMLALLGHRKANGRPAPKPKPPDPIEHRAALPAYAPAPGTQPARILEALGVGPATPKELSVLTGISPGNCVAICSKLLARGLVTRGADGKRRLVG